MSRVTLKSSTIFISVGNKTEVYRSVEDVPPALRKKLDQSTNGINSATILIADRKGKEETRTIKLGRLEDGEKQAALTNPADPGPPQAVKKSLATSYQGIVGQQKSIMAKLEQTKKEALDLQGRSIRYNILKREVDTDRTIYNGLLQRLNEVGVTSGTSTSSIAVIDRAT